MCRPVFNACDLLHAWPESFRGASLRLGLTLARWPCASETVILALTQAGEPVGVNPPDFFV